jgi:hypothetical protein
VKGNAVEEKSEYYLICEDTTYALSKTVTEYLNGNRGWQLYGSPIVLPNGALIQAIVKYAQPPIIYASTATDEAQAIAAMERIKNV